MAPFRQNASSPIFHRLAEGECVPVNRIRAVNGAPMVLVVYVGDKASGSRSTSEGGCQISCMGFISVICRDQRGESHGS